MHQKLAFFITMTMLNNTSWLTENSWNCLNFAARKYFSNNTVVIIGDFEPKFLDLGLKDRYITYNNVPHKYESYDVILIYQKLEFWQGNDIHGKIILLTESLDNIGLLWQRFKVADLIVILQTQENCELYTWFPYEVNNGGKISLKLLDVFKNGQLVNNSDLFNMRTSQTLSGNTLNISFAECAPYVKVCPNNTSFGPELKILDALVRRLNMKYIQSNYKVWPYYYGQNGSPPIAFALLANRGIDIVGGCMGVAPYLGAYDFLPFHMQDSTTWFLPGPEPQAIAFGFITALTYDIWIAIGALFVIVFSFVVVIVPSKPINFSFMWTFTRFLGLPNDPLGETVSLRCFGLTLEFGILVITAIYRSLILLQLYKTPMLILSTASEGLEYGLVANIRNNDLVNINRTDHELWNKILAPGKYYNTSALDYQTFLYKRSTYMLGRRTLDTATMIQNYPNISFRSAVTIQKENLMTTDMVFILPSHHPLTEILSVALLNVVEAGLPYFYVEETLRSMPYEKITIDETQKPLKVSQMVTMFYLLLLLLTACCIVFLIELSPQLYNNKIKKKPSVTTKGLTSFPAQLR